MIWQGTESDLLNFMDILNNNKNIKMSIKYSHKFVDFLDVFIFKDPEGSIQTDMFRKETAVNVLLHASLVHPAPTKNGIPVDQFIRVHRLCSTENLFFKQANDLKIRFQERGYKKETIQRGFEFARLLNREKLLVPKRKYKENEQSVQFFSTFNER